MVSNNNELQSPLKYFSDKISSYTSRFSLDTMTAADFNKSLAFDLKNDTNALQEYASAIRNGSSQTEAFNQYMVRTSKTAQEFAQRIQNSATENNRSIGDILSQFTQDGRNDILRNFSKNANLKDGIGNLKAILNGYNGAQKKMAELSQSGSDQLQHVQESYSNWIATVGQGNSNLQTYLSGLDGAAASVQGYAGALVKAKAGQIALAAGQMALNTVLSAGLSFAVGAAISGIVKLINKAKEAREEQIKLGREAYESQISLDTSLKNYDSAKAAYTAGTGSKEALNSATMDLIASLGYEESQIDSLIVKYGSLANAAEQLSGKETAKNLQDMRTALLAGTEEFGLDRVGAYVKFSSQSKFKDIFDKEDLGPNIFGSIERAYYNHGDMGSLSSKIKAYEEAVEDLQKIEDYAAKNNISTTEMLQDDAYKQISAFVDRYEDKYSELMDFATRLDQDVAQKALDSISPDKLKNSSFDQIFNQIKQKATENGDFAIDADTFNKTTEAYLSTLPGLAEKYNVKLRDEQNKLNNTFKKVASNAGLSDSDYEGLFGKGNDFTNQVDSYIKKTNSLQSALLRLKSGDSAASVFRDLAKEIDTTGLDANNLERSIQSMLGSMNTSVIDAFSSQMSGMTGLALADMETLQDAVLNLGDLLSSTELSVDVDVETSRLEQLKTVLSESAGATGLTSESIEAVKNSYQSLASYDPATLFEKTANGVHLNADALAACEKELQSNNLAQYTNRMDALKQKYGELTKEIEGSNNSARRMTLEAERDGIAQQIEEVGILKAQYDGLTSSYNQWLIAQAGGGEDQMANNFKSMKDELQEMYDNGKTGATFRKGVQTMTDEDISNWSVDEVEELYQRGSKTIDTFFNGTRDGLIAFAEEAERIAATSDEFKWEQNEDGKYEIDLNGKDKEFAKLMSENGWQMSTEELQAGLKALLEYGDFEIHLATEADSLEELQSELETTKSALEEITGQEYDISLTSTSLEDIQSQISTFEGQLQEVGIMNADGTINVNAEGAAEATEMLVALKMRAAELSETPVVLNATANTQEAQSSLDNLKAFVDAYQELEIRAALGVDTTEAQANVDSTLAALEGDPIVAELNIDTSSAQSAIDSIKGLGAEDINKSASIQVTADTSQADAQIAGLADQGNKALTVSVQVTGEEQLQTLAQMTEQMQNKSVSVTANTQGKGEVDALKTSIENLKDKSVVASATTSGKGQVDALVGSLNSLQSKSVTATVTTHRITINEEKTIKTSSLNGTAHLRGTAHINGTAYASGNWGTTKSGEALVGEVGREIVVYPNGVWETVGEYGAEFVHIPKGSVVFNSAQTENLLNNGYISGNGRGKMAYLNGTAYSYGSGGFSKRWDSNNYTVPTYSSPTYTASANNYTPAQSSKSSSSSNSSSSSSNTASASEAKEETKDTIDWIEIAIERIERTIKNLGNVAKSSFKVLADRMNASSNEIKYVTEELSLQQRAYDRYLEHINSLGLSSDLAERVKNGTVDINEYDQDTAKLIKDYESWWKKLLDCDDALKDLHEDLGELYKDRFDDTAEDFENQLKLLEHMTTSYDNGIKELEELGFLGAKTYYELLSDVERENIKVMEKEISTLTDRMSEAVNSGEIAEGSKAWYEMQKEINKVKESLQEAHTNLIEFANEIRNLDWEVFDFIQDRIEKITDESEFLIDLLSNSKLHTDKGQLTDEGMTTMGLHGVKYNVFMNQADQYAEEMRKISQDLAKDPYDTELIKRKEELIELQQKSILNAEDEKQAIKDLVEEGIDLEIDSLKELIDAYKDRMDSTKDLYDYQKKVKKQTEEIAQLQKQMTAYENDTSEEARAKIQEIKVNLNDAIEELKETEYDKFISSQKELLDDLIIDYEETLNLRLDNIDALMLDMIDAINANAVSIADTLSVATDKVGYTMTDSMQSIWNGSITRIISAYTSENGQFRNLFTTTNEALKGIKNTVDLMWNNSEAKAKIDAAKVKASTATSKPASTPAQPAAQAPAVKTIKVGGLINAGSAPIYGNDKGEPYIWGTHQYFASDPIYTVLAESNGYVKVRYHKLSSGVSGWFKKSDIKAYKTGGLVDYTGMAQLDGTPSKPEMVLNPKDTENFLKATETIRAINLDNIKSPTVRPGESNGFNITTGDLNPTIQIENIQNYEDFMEQMKKDKSFEELFSTLTNQILNGGKRLAKRSINFKI